MAKVNINGKFFDVSDDPIKQKREIQELSEANEYPKVINKFEADLDKIKAWLLSLPAAERDKMKRSESEMDNAYNICKKDIESKYKPTDRLSMDAMFPKELKFLSPKEGVLAREFCSRYRNAQRMKNQALLEIEAGQTSKSGTPEPVPSSSPISPTQPKTQITNVNQNGTIKSFTKSISETLKPEKPQQTVSTPSGTSVVASTQPATYSSNATSNKVSEKVHVVNTQRQSKHNQSEVLNKVAENLIPIESNIKAGGNQLITYEKDKHETIGSVINTFPCIRKDVSGEFRPKSILIEGKGSFVNYAPVSYTEEVENSRFPCGTYSLNVGNKYDVSVGAGGANISTAGNMRLGSKGRTLISSAEEINVSSGNGNVNIRAGHNVSIKGDSLTLETPNQVVVNANLGVAKNAIINGCAFVDGELFVNHITCPAEVQYTGGGIGSFGQLMVGAGADGSQKGNGGGGAVIAYADVSYIKKLLTTVLKDSRGDGHAYDWSMPDKIPVMVLPDTSIGLASTAGNTAASNPEYSVFIYPHEHPFNNIPLSFTTGNEEMRARASILNSGNIGVASPIQHGYKTPTA